MKRLNKQLIYGFMMGASLIGTSLIFLPLIFNPKKGNTDDHPHKTRPQAFLGGKDAFALSGTEGFPQNYAELKKFEKEIEAEKPKVADDQLLEAFALLEKLDSKEPHEIHDGNTFSPQPSKIDPWQEAKEQELKRRASDYYAARRSDIKFIDYGQRGHKQAENVEAEDPMMRMMKRSLDLAENQLQPPTPNKDDMFFINAARDRKDDRVGKIQDALPHMISEGTLIPAILLTEVDTSLPGPILARVSYNIWDSKTGQTLLIPQNSKLIGEYSSSIGHGQSRAQIVWKRIIYPNQQSVDLGSMVGVDKKGASGTNGLVNNHYDKVALGLLMTSAIGSSVRITQGKYDEKSATFSQEMGNSLAQETARLGNKIIDKALSIPPTIKVPMGERLNVFVEQDLSLQPYAG